MGTTKINTYSNEIIEVSNLFRAIGHPARLQIIQLIQKETTCYGTKINTVLSLSQSTISKHVSELKKVNLIESKMIKNSVCYSINNTIWHQIEDFFKTHNNDLIGIETNDKNSVTTTKRKNSNLKKNNYEFKHLVLKSKKP